MATIAGHSVVAAATSTAADDLPKRRVCVLGATGSVGGAALDVLRRAETPASVGALVAGQNDKAMAALCREFKPQAAVMANEQAAARLKESLRGENIIIGGGAQAVRDVATDDAYDTVIAASSGTSAAFAVLAAAQAGKRLLLANKESLILCGDIIVKAAQESGGELLPIDSEHCALFELLDGGGDYKKLWLTASGGAVRDIPPDKLIDVKPAAALAHPNWTMGAKITVDSSTMMNKALEVIEASVLFGAGPSRIGAVLHRQSTTHALVEYADGSMKMQIAAADMRLPVARMLCWPGQPQGAGEALSWRALSAQTFEEPDARRYPCLQLAYRALAMGKAAGAVLSAANDVAVGRFLRGDIPFTTIARINAEVLGRLGDGESGGTLAELMAADNAARQMAEAL
ncbi:MAG: 1-deoxy-D-xylulose-5-phosphate reductoisomerase [Gammaproteobacteria bacterium]